MFLKTIAKYGLTRYVVAIILVWQHQHSHAPGSPKEGRVVVLLNQHLEKPDTPDRH